MNSLFLKLGKNDLIKGAIMAGIGAIAGAAKAAYVAGTLLDIHVLQGMGETALFAAGAYLFKNLFTNSTGNIGPEKQ